MAFFDFFDSKSVEWADMSVLVAGAPLTKIAGVKYGVKVAKTHLHLAGDEPASIQSGNREPTGSLKVEKTALDIMNAAAVAAGGRDVTDLEFDLSITFRAKGARLLQTNILVGVQISQYEYALDQGTDKALVELPFLFLRLGQA